MAGNLKKIPSRLVLCTKDIINITGKSNRICRKMMQCVKDVFGKTKKQFITVKEFCHVYGLNEDHVNTFL